MAKYDQMANEILTAVGGKENVSSATQCMTRLRLILKNEEQCNDEALQKISGVLKVIHAGGQCQVVIGQTVDKVYDEVCKLGVAGGGGVEDESAPKQKLTPKVVMNNIMGAISGSITPVLPVFIVAGIFKMVPVLFGPKNLGVLSDTSHIYMLCNLVSAAAYYFLPFFIAHSAAKKFNCSPILAMLFAGIMIHPDMLAIVASGEPFTVFGIPMQSVNYVQAVFPVIIIVWIMSYVEKWIKKIVPDMLRTIGVPVLTTLIMLPLGLCLLGPICSVIMGYMADLIIWMTNNIGLPTIVVVGILWNWIIAFGMHVPVLTALLPTWMEMGYDAIVSPGTIATTTPTYAVELAYALRAKGKENKSLGWSCLVTSVTANIGEPYLYGIYMRDWKAMLWHTIGAGCGALTFGLLGAKVVIFSGVGFGWLNFLRFGEDAVKGAIGMIVAFVVSFALSMVFGFTDGDKNQVSLMDRLKKKTNREKTAV